MYKILKAETLAAKIHLMVVHAPRVASHCQPGQFIIVKMDEKGERIPLTICDYDREEGTVTIVFQEVGASTIRMSELKAGDSFRDFVGPLGCPSEFVHEDIEELKDIKNTAFVVVGPPIMMKFTVAEILKRGVAEENIWVSYERKMCCGLGKCGHCKMDDTYICLDGPVFNYTKAKNLVD